MCLYVILLVSGKTVLILKRNIGDQNFPSGDQKFRFVFRCKGKILLTLFGDHIFPCGDFKKKNSVASWRLPKKVNFGPCFVPLNMYFAIYLQMIQPYLLYGITEWGQAGKTHRNIFLRLQKRALCVMFFCDYKTHAVPLFISSSLLPLDLLYFKSVAILMHDVSKNILPQQISNLFQYQHNIHSHITRSSTRGTFFLKYSRTSKQNMSFLRNAVRIWNSLSSKFHQMPKTKFKRDIHNKLCSYRNSWRQTNILIYRIWTCLEYQTYYICIILSASHVICFIFLWILFLLVFLVSQMPYWSIFNYYYYYYYYYCYQFYLPFVCFFWFHYLICTLYLVQ